MYAVVVHHMDDASLMDEAGFLFFCNGWGIID